MRVFIAVLAMTLLLGVGSMACPGGDHTTRAPCDVRAAWAAERGEPALATAAPSITASPTVSTELPTAAPDAPVWLSRVVLGLLILAGGAVYAKARRQSRPRPDPPS